MDVSLEAASDQQADEGKGQQQDEPDSAEAGQKHQAPDGEHEFAGPDATGPHAQALAPATADQAAQASCQTCSPAP